jgi:hypothetical protein
VLQVKLNAPNVQEGIRVWQVQQPRKFVLLAAIVALVFKSAKAVRLVTIAQKVQYPR